MVGAQPGGTVISGGGSSGGGGGGTGSGTVTSVAMSVPTGFQISGSPITSAGTLALTFTSGYALPTTADVSKGVTAYGWGNHADAGYLTSSSLNGYATQQWVGQQGFLTSSALTGYATQQWVQQQGYLTSSALTGYATQQWVQQQGYLTSVPSGYATETWVQQQGYLTSIPSNYVSVDNNGMLSHQVCTDDQLILYGTGNNFGELVFSDASLTNAYTLTSNSNGRMTFDGNVLAYSSEIPVGHSVYGGLTSGYANVGNDDYVRWDMPFTFDPSDGGTVTPAFLPLSGGTVTGNLTVSGNITANQSAAKTQSVLDSNATNGVYMYWDNSGYFHFNGDTAAPRGYVFDANVNSSSDARLKNIVSHAGFEVDKLATLPLVWFTWKKDERRRMHFGSIAQEWQKVLPEVVSENGDGMLSMDYGAAAMAAGVTACREIVRLKAEIERLKKRLN